MPPTKEDLLARTRIVPSFPTLVFKQRLADAAEINTAIKQIVLEKVRAYGSKGYSNFGGWHSGYSFSDWGGLALQRILETAKQLASRATKPREGRAQNLPWDIKCWANVIRRGNANNMHTHVGCF